MLGRIAGVLVALPIAFVGCGGRVQLDIDPNSGGASGVGGAKSNGGTPATGGAFPVAGTLGSGGWHAGGAPVGPGGAPSFGGFGFGGAQGGAPNVGGGSGGFGKGGAVQGGASQGGASQGGASVGGAPPTTGGTTTSGGSPGLGGGPGGCPPCRPYEPGACSWEYCDMSSRKCVTLTLDAGQSCDDHDFCTVGETCLAGRCQGGSPNTCGYPTDGCAKVACDPGGFCKWSPTAPDGAACKPNDLCQQNGSCSKGICVSTPKDCSSTRLPGQCYSGQCNPGTGFCEAVPVSNVTCTLPGDLCSAQAVCKEGVCYATSATDCSSIDTVCGYGECDPKSGGCLIHNYPDGTGCGGGACAQNDTCQVGVCKPGAPVTSCVNGDGCCPAGCSAKNDTDCSATVVFDAYDRGWWDSSGDHESTNDNMYTGVLGSIYNSYLVFDLTSVTQPITGAVLYLELENFYGMDPWEQVSLWDVTTDATRLEASARGATRIFNDLQSGNTYGSTVAYSTDIGDILPFTLNAAAIADINAARGGYFSLGLHIDSIGGVPQSNGEGLRFSESSEHRTQQLQLTTAF